MVTSFNGDDRYIYYTLEISGGPNATGPTLYRIDPATLQITSQLLAGLTSRLIGSGFVGGVLYGFTDEGQIYQINKLTGEATLTGAYDPGIPPGGGPPFTGVFGVVATPEPGTLLLLGGRIDSFRAVAAAQVLNARAWFEAFYSASFGCVARQWQSS